MTAAPLSDLRVAVTRPLAPQGEDTLVALLRGAGAIALHLPLIRILPPVDLSPLLRAARDVEGYDWIVFTSPRAVQPLSDALRTEGVAPEQLASLGVRVCAVGPATASALEAAGIDVDLIPRRFDAEGVVEALESTIHEKGGGRVLFPRAEEGREIIPTALSASGIPVDVIPVYRTVPLREEAVRLAKLVQEGAIDVLTFTSGSAVRSFASAWTEDRPPAVGVFSLGPSSTAALSEFGFPIHGEAKDHTLSGLIAALDKWTHM